MNDKYKKDFLHAGKIARDVRAFGKSLVKTGASYNDIVKQINQKIFELGAKPAFPPQLALNFVAAHYLPEPETDIIFSDEIVKLDIGVCYNGAIGDCAVTIDLSGKFQGLIDAAEAALLAAEKIIKVGLPIREIGKIIEQTIASHGFTSIKNLSGHGLGPNKIHTSPTIPNYEDRSSLTIRKGMTFAIEPFATNGKGFIYEAGNPTIFSFLSPRVIKSEQAKALLPKIRAYEGLPFAIHDLIDENFSLETVRKGLTDLLKINAIAGYAPLIEQAHGMVAQAENSVLVDDDGNVFISTR